MSPSNAPRPPISKKRNAKPAKETKKCDNEVLEVSPVNIKSVASSVDKKIKASSSSACRKLDLTNVNLLELSTGGTALKTAGALHKHAKQYLVNNKFGKVDVDLTCSVIRWPVPEEWEGFTFLLFCDNTGCVSIASNVETFSAVEEICKDSKVPRSAVSIKGTINFKWSNKKAERTLEREIYMNIRKKGAVISLAECVSFPQSFSAFHTMREIIGMPYNSSATFPFLFGDCVLIQDDVDMRKKSFMLQDATGFAVIHVMEWNFEEENSDDIRPGYTTMLFKGCFNLNVVEVNGVDSISTSLERKDVTFMTTKHTLMTRHITMIEKTDKGSYMFPFDGNYDIRTA